MLGEEEEKREKVEDPRDYIIPAHTHTDPGSQIVDLRKGRPMEENWSYLIALILGILFILVFVLVAHFVLRPVPIG
jgi:hypothetical protein